MSKRQIRRLDRERQDLILEGIRSALDCQEGRRLLTWLFEQTNILGNAFREDERSTAFALGQQNIGQMLLALMEQADPEGWFRLRNEQIIMLEELKALEEVEEDE